MKISKEEFLSLAGMEHETLDAWIEGEWLVPGGSPVELSFTEIDIARAQLIRDLQVGFGVNDEGVDVILNLVDQLYGMRRMLRELRQGIQTTPE
jgi:chaperone modulatory protein CbpM